MVISQNVKLLLHGENGCFPFLSPHQLETFFSPNSAIVHNHLLLGISLNDSCVHPVFDQEFKRRKLCIKNEKGKKEKNMKAELSKSLNSKDLHNTAVNYSKDYQSLNEKGAVTKPVGYTFAPMIFGINDIDCAVDDCRHEGTLINLPPSSTTYHRRCSSVGGYKTVFVSTFDLIDDLTAFARKNKRKKGKETEASSKCVSEIFVTSFSNNKHAGLITNHGVQNISPKLYVKVAKSMKCEAIVGLYDQFHEKEGKKRKHIRINRNDSWVSMILSRSNSDDEECKGESCNFSSNNSEKFWAPILMDDTSLSVNNKYSQSLNGVALVGWHHMESRTRRVEFLKECVSMFGNEKDVVIMATSNIQQVIDAVRNGANIIGTQIPANLARSKRALLFNLTDWNSVKQTETQQFYSNDCGVDLTDKIFVRDSLPLVHGCSCLSCKEGRHSRSYIHHLLHANEILAQILLFAHNLQQMLLFCEFFCESVSLGKVEKFCSYVETQL